MTMPPDEDQLDLAPLARDADERAARIAARVAERVAASRRAGVVDYLARLAVPAMLAAAASVTAVLATQPARVPAATAAAPRDLLTRVMGDGGPVSLADLIALAEEGR